MRAIFTALLGAALIVPSLSASAAQTACDEGEQKIRFSHVVADKGHPKGEAAAEFAARVNATFEGRYCVEVYPSSTLFSDDDVLDALVAGDVEMAAPSLSKFETYTLAFRIFDLPFLFEDIAAVERFQTSPAGEAMKSSMRDRGILGLAYWHNGMKQMSANRPLKAPEDAAGLKFRIQSSDVLDAQFRALGAEPVKLAFKDVYDALGDGRVQGQENTWTNIYTKKFYTRQDGVTETNHGIIDYLVIVSRDWWEGLPAADRAGIGQILVEVSHEYNRFSFELNELAKMRILENGGAVRRLTKGNREKWVDVLTPVWRQFENEIGASLIEAALASNRR
ncbi:DctP family TRAP transporter solute-binding subunit [Limibaculum sp. M0105]|uniref:DctP family TRAP transporter solute-binding subunit n=1 Tax=Thermohalobaculum xanthum TaxID=2753746 RepID=A0A8J7SGA7_9RHOB|nr:DctP family TRAP transporter solute-binding subunit [Thermohalobaculum xanthum]MBK0400741.1 DctP family TRAP transporter solute-binding subunit [Thermohalobaculum xanthum]